MKNILLLITVLGIIHAPRSFATTTTKETIYSGKLDQAKLQSSLLVSKYYEVKLHQDRSSSFLYDLKPGLKNEDFNTGIYKATAFTLLPSISSKLAMSLKIDFTQIGEFKIEGETISFEGDLSIDKTKIGSVKYEFNLYALPIRRVYNPKVTRTMENTKEGFIIVENREVTTP